MLYCLWVFCYICLNAENEIKNDEYFYDYSVINEEGKLDEAIQKVTAIIKNNFSE